ncbi:ATP-binding protein [Stenotrophomonas geniculata]|uniref:ATP-binding protein n=1 Tax=Stenotrophomonas geniculata TaxID=86188 RepID=UPI002E76E276|nr:ATP-binding protein [Stenotrophomonas geniculata]
MEEYEPLDSRQINRIEAVHRGYLYQHLYAAGCLLLAGASGVRAVTVEMDEDVEIAYESGDRLYIQIKTRLAPLIPSDINTALKRFEEIDAEHQSGRRTGSAAFAIVANVAAGPSLQALVDGGGLAMGATLLTPSAPTPSVTGLPPAWGNLAEAARWCAARAKVLPLATLEPDTLVWKLAGQVMLAATGQVPGHAFLVDDLPELFEQLAIQLQKFPSPPEVYRPLANEPPLDSAKRVRIISGLSGSGKTAWAAQAAMHRGGACAYYDVGDVPGPAIAASLVRELAAQWAAPAEGGLRRVLLPGTTGTDALRALDRFLGGQDTQALVVLDNVHRVPAAGLRAMLDATEHLQFVLLAQPSVAISELEAMLGLTVELLEGWSLDEAAAEAHAQGVEASAETLGRLEKLTGGLPLYIRSAFQLSTSQYSGHVAALCSAVEAHTNLVETAQEVILSRSFAALSAEAQDCVAVLSVSDSPMSQSEAEGWLQGVFGTPARSFAAVLRELRPLGIVRLYGAQRLQIHDAYRILGKRRLSTYSAQQERLVYSKLKDLIFRSLEPENAHRLPLLISTLVVLGDYDTLIDVATEEWFHEFGVDAGIWAALEAVVGDESVDARQRFYALDGLVFAQMRKGRYDGVDQRLDAMDALIAEHGLGAREALFVGLKRLALASDNGDDDAVQRAIDCANRLMPKDPQYQRVLRYSIARAMLKIGRRVEAHALANTLVREYLQHLGLTESGIVGKRDTEIRLMLRSSPTMNDDLRHLADTYDVLARSAKRRGMHTLQARLQALKFYAMANAIGSFLKIGQDLAEEFVNCGRPELARELMEADLLPLIQERRMLDHVVQVRGRYALVLSHCGEHEAALEELERLDAYRAGLAVEQCEELDAHHRDIVRRRLHQSRSH